MLKDSDAIATIAVSDIKAAREFYEGTIGFVPDKTEGAQVVAYKSGASKLLVYQSQFAGTNQATAATWAVDDVAGVVNQLKAKGVIFER